MDGNKYKEVGKQFMDIMEDYQDSQTDDPNFDPVIHIHDLYHNLVDIYDSAKKDLEV